MYVEDEETDIFFMQRAFAKEGLETALRTVKEGQEAINYLSGTGEFAERSRYPVPALVLLDLNLPAISGFEVLRWIRAHPVHKQMPVVVFSSSPRNEDRAKATGLGANDYVQKPRSGALWPAIVRLLKSRWLGGAPSGAAPQPA